MEATNHSLSASSWKQYTAIWERLKKIVRETGVAFFLPLITLMVQSITGFFLVKGLRADTVRTYLSAVMAANTTRGLEAPARSENAISAALRGAKNRDCLDEEDNPVQEVELSETAGLLCHSRPS